MRAIYRSFFGAALAGVYTLLSAEEIRFSQITKAAIEQRLRDPPQKNDTRERELKERFDKAGCPAAQLIEQPVKHIKAPNLICTIPAAMALSTTGAARRSCRVFSRASSNYLAAIPWSTPPSQAKKWD